MHRKLLAVCLIAGFTATGCSSVRMVRKPSEYDSGVRYWRPKPYLLVTPADPTGRMVNLKLEYLPDFNEEYSAHLKGKASIALQDGWNLVGVNTKEAAPKKEAEPVQMPPALPNAVVAATNLPIGYYESIFEVQGDRKWLKGWRYIGMTVLGGNKPDTCHRKDGNPNCPDPACQDGPLYGIVFFNGVMTFRQLDEIAGNQLCPMFVDPAPNRNPSADVPVPVEPRQPPDLSNKPDSRGKPLLTPKPDAPAPVPPPPAGLVPPTPSPTPPSIDLKPANAPGGAMLNEVKDRKVVDNLPPLPPGIQ